MLVGEAMTISFTVILDSSGCYILLPPYRRHGILKKNLSLQILDILVENIENLVNIWLEFISNFVITIVHTCFVTILQSNVLLQNMASIA